MSIHNLLIFAKNSHYESVQTSLNCYHSTNNQNIKREKRESTDELFSGKNGPGAGSQGKYYGCGRRAAGGTGGGVPE